MHAVIFRAEINELDSEYYAMAESLRELAINDYGCVEFTSIAENNSEITISYWPSLESIITWQKDPDHIKAQGLGKLKWYKSYKVQIVDIQLEYNSSDE